MCVTQNDARSNDASSVVKKEKPRIFTYDNKLIAIQKDQNMKLAKLISFIPRLQGTGFMYVYNFQDIVSNAISNGGTFEAHLNKRFIALMNIHPDAKFIDFGANIGLYSLIAAHMKREVAAIEANPRNAAVFLKSIEHNKFSSNINLLNLAVGQESNKVVSLATENGNMGNTIVQEKSNGAKLYDNHGRVNQNIRKSRFTDIKTITMNDLAKTHLSHYKKAIVKMDIQGHELKVGLARVHELIECIGY